MAIKKTFSSKKLTVLSSGLPQFEKGKKFIMEGKVFVVTEELYSDNCQMRKIVADDGTMEVLTLTTLQGYVNSIKDFTFDV